MSDLTNDQQVDLNDPTLDPVVKAALIPQPSDPKEEKSTEEGEESPAAPTEEKTENEPKEEAVVEEANAEQAEAETTDKPTRKERREERKRFLESVRREQEQRATQREKLYQADPNYKPLEFESKDYDLTELEEDRAKYGQNEFYKGANTAAEIERKTAEQDNFWQATEYESKLLEREPEFAFLDENNTERFDPDKTAFINDSFLEFVGYDPQTKTVKRTDISYERYTRHLVENIKAWAEEMTENTEKNAAAQKGNSSIRPSGSSRKSLGPLKPGDITAMSDEEYERNKEEINRQILSAL